MTHTHDKAFGHWRWARPAGLIWISAALLAGMCYAIWTRKIDVHAENGPIERLQLIGWIGAVLVAAACVVRGRCLRDRLSGVWLGTVALLAAAREMDVHEWVQNSTSWLPPVHFRIDWMLDASEPLGAKIFWLGVFGIAGACLAVPPLIMRAPTVRFLRTGDAPTWLLLLAFGAMGMGYLFDDVLGRGDMGIHYEVTQGMEEYCELCGTLTFLFGTWCELRRPVSVRSSDVTAVTPEPPPSIRTLVADPAVAPNGADQIRA